MYRALTLRIRAQKNRTHLFDSNAANLYLSYSAIELGIESGTQIAPVLPNDGEFRVLVVIVSC
jgi:hypothetical protein